MTRSRLRYILPLSIGLGILLVYMSVLKAKYVDTTDLTAGLTEIIQRELPRSSELFETHFNPNQFAIEINEINGSLFQDNSRNLVNRNNIADEDTSSSEPVLLGSNSNSDYFYTSKSSILWEPMISLHAVKHIHKTTLPGSFINNKLSELRSEFIESETTKRRKRPDLLKNDICPTYFNETTLNKRVYPNVYGKCHSEFNPDAVTLLIQMDMWEGYFEKLYNVSNYWRGPISVAVFINSTKLLSSNKFVEENLKDEMKFIFEKYHIQNSSICVHLVISEEELTFFPVNTLRNVATKYAQTDKVFLIEADFIPMPGLDQVFNRKLLKHNLRYKKVAYVVPAFSIELANAPIPVDKKHLLSQWLINVTCPIHYSKHFKGGHKPTDYKRYRFSQKAYKVQYQTSYEPYYVIDRRRSPYYPEEFLHGFRDKTIHAQMLNKTGFEFHVLPNTYIVHTPHTKSYERKDLLLECALIAYKNFEKEYEKLLSDLDSKGKSELQK